MIAKYVVKEGDNLRKIAERFYENGELWQKIYDANRNEIGNDPNLLYPGIELLIPG